MSQPALVFEQVTRRFRKKEALSRVDLAVEPGTVLGLVGRNGSGKTTSLRLAHGFLHPDEGSIRVLGLDPVTEGLAVRTRVSLLAEESSLYGWMRIREILDFGAALHPGWDKALASSLARRLDLDPDDQIKHVSRGTQAKIALVLAVACRPELLLLDDPTAGLDPLVRREILQGVLETVSDEGGAVVYASHLVHDIERVADRIAFLDAGKVRFEGALDEIKRTTRRARAVFDAGAPEAAVDLPGRIDVLTEGRLMTVVSQAANGELEAALRRMGASEIEMESLSLEEILVAFLRRNGAEETEHV